MDYCGCSALANLNHSGRNYFDAESEIATSRHKAVAGSIGSLANFGFKIKVADEFGKTYRSNTENAGDRYNVDVHQNASTNQTGGGTQSSEGIEEGGAEGLAGTGGSGGAASDSQDGDHNNIINIGGNIALADNESRAAAGDVAAVNGDSAAQALIQHTDIKHSPIGDDQNGLRNECISGEGDGDCTDDDGENGQFDLF